MGEIVNLNQARKARDKAARAKAAAENRAKHARSKAERAAEARDEAARNALLDAVKREDEPPF